MCIGTASEREHMQLVQLGYLLQELLAVRTQPCVEHGVASTQLEVKDPLGEKKHRAPLYHDPIKRGIEV